jgi:predicted nucleic-acid-binding protein
MRSADTNVLVRLITADDREQYARVRGAGVLWVSHVVLLELSWVLSSVYKYDEQKLSRAIAMLAAHEDVVLEDAIVVQAALGIFEQRPALGFGDCLVLEVARKEGLVLLTLDRALGGMQGAEAL